MHSNRHRRNTSSLKITNTSRKLAEKTSVLVPSKFLDLFQQSDSDWQDRAAAIKTIQRVTYNLDISQFRLLKHQLPLLIQFLARVLADSHYKVTYVALQILCDIVPKLGNLIEPYLHTIIPNLIELLGDHRTLTRHSSTQILIQMMQQCSVKSVICECMHYLNHPHHKIREELVNLVIITLLKFGYKNDFILDFPGLVVDLITPLQDQTAKIRYLAVEAYAVLSNLITPEKVISLLDDSGIDQKTIRLLQIRFDNDDLPMIDSNGMINHVISQSSTSSTPRPTSRPFSSQSSLVSSFRRDSSASSVFESRRNSVSTCRSFPSYTPVRKPFKLETMNQQSLEPPPPLPVSIIRKEMEYSTLKFKKDLDSNEIFKPSEIQSTKIHSLKPIQRVTDTSPIIINAHKRLPSISTNSLKPTNTVAVKVEEPTISTVNSKSPRTMPSSIEYSDSQPIHAQRSKNSSSQRVSLKTPTKTQNSTNNENITVIDTKEVAMPMPGHSPLVKQKLRQLVKHNRTVTIETANTDLANNNPPISKHPETQTQTTNIQKLKNPGTKLRNKYESKLIDQSNQRKMQTESTASTEEPSLKEAGKMEITKFAQSGNNPEDLNTKYSKKNGEPGSDRTLNEHADIHSQLNDIKASLAQLDVSNETINDERLIHEDRPILLKSNQVFTEYPDANFVPKPPAAKKLSEASQRRRAVKATAMQVNTSAVQQKTKTVNQDLENEPVEEKEKPASNLAKGKTRTMSLNRKLNPTSSMSKEDLTSPTTTKKSQKNTFNLKSSIELLKKKDADWTEKSKALESILSILETNADSLSNCVPEIVPSVIQEIANLRSSVCKTALILTGDLFKLFGKTLDMYEDLAVLSIIKKFTDGGQFMINEAEKALNEVCSNVTPQKAITSLLNYSDSKHQGARLRISKFLLQLVCDLPVSQLGKYTQLPGEAEKMMAVLGAYIRDGSGEIRKNTKEILSILAVMPDFEKTVDRTLSDSLAAEIKRAVKQKK